MADNDGYDGATCFTRHARAHARYGDNAGYRHKRHYGFASATNARIVMVCPKVAMPLFKSEKIKQVEATAVSARERLPNRRQSETLDFEHGGHRFTLSLSRFPGKSMTTHRIDLQAPEKGHGKTRMSYLEQPIGASDSPIFAAARCQLSGGKASPDDTVATYRGDTSVSSVLCMSGKVGELAKWTVRERDKAGCR